MGVDSKRFNLTLPDSVVEAIERHVPDSEKMNFIRAAVAEKLARDFGENLSPTLARANQGARTDLKGLVRINSDAGAALFGLTLGELQMLKIKGAMRGRVGNPRLAIGGARLSPALLVGALGKQVLEQFGIEYADYLEFMSQKKSSQP